MIHCRLLVGNQQTPPSQNTGKPWAKPEFYRSSTERAKLEGTLRTERAKLEGTLSTQTPATPVHSLTLQSAPGTHWHSCKHEGNYDCTS